MIVVADTSPINYLLLIRQVEILAAIFGSVTIPMAVLEELLAPGSPKAVSVWASDPPAWLTVSHYLPLEDSTLLMLDRGERHAIALAQHLGASRLLVDDGAARREAERRGVPVVGLLGILAEAARRNLLMLPAVLEDLRETSFYVSDVLLERMLATDRRRRGGETH